MPRPPRLSNEQLARMADQLAEAGCCNVERLRKLAGGGSTDRITDAVREAHARWDAALSRPIRVWFDNQLCEVHLGREVIQSHHTLLRNIAQQVLAKTREIELRAAAAARPHGPVGKGDVTGLAVELPRLTEQLAAMEAAAARRHTDEGVPRETADLAGRMDRLERSMERLECRMSQLAAPRNGAARPKGGRAQLCLTLGSDARANSDSAGAPPDSLGDPGPHPATVT